MRRQAVILSEKKHNVPGTLNAFPGVTTGDFHEFRSLAERLPTITSHMAFLYSKVSVAKGMIPALERF